MRPPPGLCFPSRQCRANLAVSRGVGVSVVSAESWTNLPYFGLKKNGKINEFTTMQMVHTVQLSSFEDNISFQLQKHLFPARRERKITCKSMQPKTGFEPARERCHRFVTINLSSMEISELSGDFDQRGSALDQRLVAYGRDVSISSDTVLCELLIQLSRANILLP